MKRVTRFLGTVADPTRLRLLRLIYRRELCVCELMDAVRLPQYKVSRHLLDLRRIGLAESTRNGRWMHYRISRTAVRDPLVREVLEVLDGHLRKLPEAKRDDARLAKRLASGRADRTACS